MFGTRQARLEALETRNCLSVSATVTDGGDLLVEGDADGPVEIVAVGEGAYEVTDNGAVIADATTLTGVTDDVIIKLESETSDTDDTVTLDLDAEAVDMVFADLGGGDNTFELVGGTAERLVYRGGVGNDSVALDGTIESRAKIGLGDGDNQLTVEGEVGNLSVGAGDGDDIVAISEGAAVSGGVNAKLGDGDNSLAIAGTVDGHLAVSARDGADTVTLAETAQLGSSARINLGNGDNNTDVAGTIDGDLTYNGGDGNDAVNLTERADVTGDFSARLGEGENSVTLDGTVEEDFNVVSANEDDEVTIGDAAVIGGETTLGLGEQTETHGLCHNHNGDFGELRFAGRRRGFFFRQMRG